MRSGQVYERVSTVDEPAEGMHYATVTYHEDDRGKLHSRMSKYVEVPLLDRILDTLRSFAYQKM